MFFCEKCRIKNKWPTSMGGSHGRCEVCGVVANCHDVRSSNLPDTEPDDTCDECGNTIPDEPGGGIVNEHHKDSCSLYEKGKS